MGGPHVSFEIEGSFRDLPALDYIGIGEGEHTMVELARALEGRMDVRDVRGLALRDRDGRDRAHARRARSRTTSTRCPNPRATWCRSRATSPSTATRASSRAAAAPTSASSARRRPGPGAASATARPSLCVDEIEELAALGFTEITIEDDLFTLYRKHFLAVCGELVRRDTGIRWNAFSRVDTISPEIVETMARAGCQAICFGVESGSQEVLDLVKKSSNLDKVKEAMRMTQDVGHQRAGLLHHRAAGRDRGDAAQDRRVRERAAPGVRLALRLPHPGALPRHRGARQAPPSTGSRS